MIGDPRQIAHRALAGTGVNVATVVNLPSGDEDPAIVDSDVRAAIADGSAPPQAGTGY